MLISGVANKKRALRWALALAAAVALASAPDHRAKAAGAGVVDGSFEAGRFAGTWKETSTNFDTPICSFATCGDGDNGSAQPRTGSYWAWFGGAAFYEEKASLTQNVKFPSGGSATLRFYLRIGAASPDGKDYVRVYIDGQRIFTVKENSTKYDTYKLVEKDVSQFADGLRHKLQFKGKCSGDGSSVINIDDVSITAS